MKKVLAIILALTMATGLLSACGSNTNDANSNSSSNNRLRDLRPGSRFG